MGKYITHEQLPFKGKLVKIRLRNYGFNSVDGPPGASVTGCIHVRLSLIL